MAAGLTVGDFSRATHRTPLVVPAAALAIISHHGSLADADLSYARLGADDTPDEAEWRTGIGWPILRADGAPA